MSEKRVIARKYLPQNLPTGSTAVTYLMLDRFSAPGWLWGAMGLFVVLLWIVSVMELWKQEEYEVVLGQRKP